MALWSERTSSREGAPGTWSVVVDERADTVTDGPRPGAQVGVVWSQLLGTGQVSLGRFTVAIERRGDAAHQFTRSLEWAKAESRRGWLDLDGQLRAATMATGHRVGR